MGTMSVSVDENMKARMSELTEVNWSAVARKAFEDKLKEIFIKYTEHIPKPTQLKLPKLKKV